MQLQKQKNQQDKNCLNIENSMTIYGVFAFGTRYCLNTS